jgi:hypothetical protein
VLVENAHQRGTHTLQPHFLAMWELPVKVVPTSFNPPFNPVGIARRRGPRTLQAPLHTYEKLVPEGCPHVSTTRANLPFSQQRLAMGRLTLCMPSEEEGVRLRLP